MLLTDVQSVSFLQVIEEASLKNNHCPKVRGLFQRADEANQNKRVYPRTILENQVKKLQPLIKERRLCGELDHPQNDTVKLTNASHLVTKLWMEGAEVFGEAEILNTPNGKVAQALITDGVKIGISSRGLGTLSEDHMTGQKTVNEDYNLVTFDLVADPSTRGAYPSISESRILEESKYERTLKEAVEERVFITMLKNKLNEGGKSGPGGDWFEDASLWDKEKKRKKMFGPKMDDPYGGPDDPNRSEPEHMAAARRANYMATQQDLMRGQKRSEENKAWQAREAAKKKKKKKGGIRGAIKKMFRKGTNDSVEYVYTRSMERLAENKLKDRVREIAEASSGRKHYARSLEDWEANEKMVKAGIKREEEETAAAKREGRPPRYAARPRSMLKPRRFGVPDEAGADRYYPEHELAGEGEDE
jgi:hypothetical protein